jgi:hypothetical protein
MSEDGGPVSAIRVMGNARFSQAPTHILTLRGYG